MKTGTLRSLSLFLHYYSSICICETQVIFVFRRLNGFSINKIFLTPYRTQNKTLEPLKFQRLMMMEHRRKPPRSRAPAALTAHVPRLRHRFARRSLGSVQPGLFTLRVRAHCSRVKKREAIASLFFTGGAYGARTRDLLTASQTRSQLRQCPMM